MPRKENIEVVYEGADSRGHLHSQTDTRSRTIRNAGTPTLVHETRTPSLAAACEENAWIQRLPQGTLSREHKRAYLRIMARNRKLEPDGIPDGGGILGLVHRACRHTTSQCHAADWWPVNSCLPALLRVI